MAAGMRISCASSVPANRLPTSQTTARLKSGSDVLPSITSSVITDIWGSMNTNIRIVAVPFTTADRVLEVTRNAGFKYPAYSEAKTPVVQRAIAATTAQRRALERVSTDVIPSQIKVSARIDARWKFIPSATAK